MARVPVLSRLSREDFKEAPDWFGRFLDMLSPFVGDVSSALGGQLDSSNLRGSEKAGIKFSGGDWATLANELGATPKRITIGKLERKDGVEIAAPFSLIWGLTSQGQIRLKVLGVIAGTVYLLTVAYE